jgi:hypothetical protein
VTLKLAELRPGFVYELRLRNLAPGATAFFTAEAHYTLQVVPKGSMLRGALHIYSSIRQAGEHE